MDVTTGSAGPALHIAARHQRRGHRHRARHLHHHRGQRLGHGDAHAGRVVHWRSGARFRPGATGARRHPSGRGQDRLSAGRAIFPPNEPAPDVHVTRTPGQTTARLNFSSESQRELLRHLPAGRGQRLLRESAARRHPALRGGERDARHQAHRAGRWGRRGAEESAPSTSPGPTSRFRGDFITGPPWPTTILPGYTRPMTRRQDAGHRHRHPALRLRQGRRPRPSWSTPTGARADLRGSPPRRPTAGSASGATPSATTARRWPSPSRLHSRSARCSNLTTLTLPVLNPAARPADHQTDINYYKQFRTLQSRPRPPSGPTATHGQHVPVEAIPDGGAARWPTRARWCRPGDEYKGNPFWSQNGKFLSSPRSRTPDVLVPYNPTA